MTPHPHRTRRHWLQASSWLLLAGAGHSPAATAAASMKLRIQLPDQTLIVTLDEHPTTRDLLTLLPLSLVLEDYAATEKIATLPRKLSTASAPAAHTPSAGDFCYYAPWGNLALFHTPFQHSPGLVRLGRIDGDLAALRVEGRLPARIEHLAT